MKKNILFTLLILLTRFTAQAQPPMNLSDTLSHLQAIYHDRAAFIGQPFSKLLDSLKLDIVYFSPIGGDHGDRSKETNTGFFFIDPDSEENFPTRYLNIYWNSYLDITVGNQLYYSDSGVWNAQANQYYRTQIIEDIYVSDDIKDFNTDLMPALQTNRSVENNPAFTSRLQGVIANINKSNKYANQPFSVLWNDLAVKPKTVLGKSGTDPGM